MANQDRQRQEQKKFEQTLTLKLSQVIERKTNTRTLYLKHVEALAKSIAVLGLLEPLVVDSQKRLLAGRHRLAAIRLLKEQNPQAYQTHFSNEAIQVRIMPFDTDSDPDLALQVEIAENEHRRDYTPSEVRALADRLQKQGYKLLKGRPKEGEKSLVLALAFVINKSKRTVERYLKEKNLDLTHQSPTTVALCQERTALKSTYKNLRIWEKALNKEPETPKRKSLAKKIPSMMRLIDETIAEINAILSHEK